VTVASGTDDAFDIGLHQQRHDRIGNARLEITITGFGQ
jgi:hypothetical protein